MSYQALARRYRPSHLSQVVGQDNIVKAITNALTHQRLHHAYLFTGTRGVGKTTLARLLAQCLQCEAGISAEPCGTCHSCTMHLQGAMPDFIEIDAASKTKVEDTRTLLEGIIYGPVVSRFKIYLIDEVHMLSQHSFNALLKTLEEPPEYIKFVFATTDSQKIPPTILSRCIQFSLRPLTIEQISEHLAHVLQQENIRYESAALFALARAAHGSVRDALSLLDQAIHLSCEHITESIVLNMLGTANDAWLETLLNALAECSMPQLQECFHHLWEQGCDEDQLLKQLSELFHHIALLQQDLKPSLLLLPELLQRLAREWSPEEVQLYYDLINRARRDLNLAPSPQIGFEMGLLRLLAFRPRMTSPKAPTTLSKPMTPAAQSPAPALTPPLSKNEASSSSGWDTWAQQLPVKGLTATLLQHCTFDHQEGTHIHLLVESQHSALINDRQQQLLEEALQQLRGSPYKVHFKISDQKILSPMRQQQVLQEQKQQQASVSLQQDASMQHLLSSFDVELKQNMIDPK